MKSAFARQALTLMGGTTLAQLIPIAASPLLTRIYAPDEFGAYAFFVAINAILAIVATGRYEAAILIPRRHRIAAHLLFVAIAIALAFTLIAYLLLFIAYLYFGTDVNIVYFVAAPASVMFASTVYSTGYWFNRILEYKKMAYMRVVQSAVFVIVSVSIGVYGSLSDINGLIIAFVAGQMAAALLALYWIALVGVEGLETLSRSTASFVMRRYRRFPQFLIAAQILNTGAIRLPALLLPSMFGARVAGNYSLAQQSIGLPTTIIAQGIGDVFRQHASQELAANGECRQTYLKTLRALAIIAVVPFLASIPLAPWMFTTIFGPNWSDAGWYAQIMAPMFLLQFLASPLSSMFIIAEKQDWDVRWQIGLVCLTVGALLCGWMANSVTLALVLFSASYSFMYIVNLCLSFRLSAGKKKLFGPLDAR